MWLRGKLQISRCVVPSSLLHASPRRLAGVRPRRRLSAYSPFTARPLVALAGPTVSTPHALERACTDCSTVASQEEFDDDYLWGDNNLFYCRDCWTLWSEKETRGKSRANVQPGIFVDVVKKQDQRTGRLTAGAVASVLTNSQHHPHGIKVKLSNGVVGRVKVIHENSPVPPG